MIIYFLDSIDIQNKDPNLLRSKYYPIYNFDFKVSNNKPCCFRNTSVRSFHTLSSLLTKDEVTTKSLSSYGSGGKGSDDKQRSRLEAQQAVIGLRFHEAIVNYVVHHQLPFLGSEFEVRNEEVADILLSSGVAGPERTYVQNGQTVFVFSAKDFIGYEVGKRILEERFGTEELMKKIIQEKIYLILKSFDYDIDLKSIVMLRLVQLDGTRLSTIGCFKPLITNNPNLKDHIFKCKHCLDPNGYVEYCISKGVIKPKKGLNGEQLFWTHFAEKKWDLLDGVFMIPSDAHHNDVFGINRVEGSTDMIIPMGLQCKAQAGTKFDPHSYFSSTIPELFYLDNYAQLKSETLYNLNSYHIEETKINNENRFVVKDNSKNIIDDANGKSMKVNSSAKWYNDIRNDVLEVFKSSKMMQVCVALHTPETFPKEVVEKYQKNYLCSFIDRNNYNLLFDNEWEIYLNVKNFFIATKPKIISQ
ncbi:hypothetical protein FDP41_008056 [Naegleria fowleri]|uniref:Uncharacterized protein n=1 Tax=Naegleria fowleri TaxID=5763 RepID=A0A6A5CA92_NAEFO|nr:uncharacterized protein FDP41_008056 [Naegleria fowleri]KAF0984141.1 hypothetical protein FDP41_008056 [Naegleria fowleri]